jgi:hypothetical protein
MEAGTYNVVKATCVMRCTTCHGATSFWTQTGPFGVAVSGQKQLNAIVQYDSGGQSDLTTSSSWSSDTTSVATVSSGLVHGVSSGSVNIIATSPTQTQAGIDCQPYTPPPCPRLPMQFTGPGNVCNFTVTPANVVAQNCTGASQNSNNFATNITPSACLANSAKSKCGATSSGGVDLVVGSPSCVFNLGSPSGTVKYFAGPKLPDGTAGQIDMVFDLYFDVIGTDIVRDVNATVQCP